MSTVPRTICQALLVLALAVLSIPVALSPVAAAPRGEQRPRCATNVEFLGFSDALNRATFSGTNVGGLSGLAYAGRDTYLSLVDNEASTPARFYTLRIPLRRDTLGTPEILDVTILRDASGAPFTGDNFDGEGIVLTRRGNLLISSENEPAIRLFSSEGALLDELPVPRRFLVAPAGEAVNNQTFESLALSPNGRSLFTANEGPLAVDAATADGRNRIRILRYENRGRGGFVPEQEFFYLTEPGQSVVEIVALSERELLVLERGFVSGQGNTIRVFRVSLSGAEDVSDEASLATANLQPVEKTLLFDLADCPSSGATTPGTQVNPLLDNFESLALGPRLPGGRRALILQSDNNFGSRQVTRVIAVAVDFRDGGDDDRDEDDDDDEDDDEDDG